jgi:SET domain-containing protein
MRQEPFAPKPFLIELKASKIHLGGVGVFALRRISEGDKVGEGVTEESLDNIVPWESIAHLDPETRQRVINFTIGTVEGFIPPPATDFNSLPFVYYFNHSCEGNCGFNTAGEFVAIRDIEKGEELTSDYGLAESNPIFAMKCECGSMTCRQTITGNDWKDSSFRAQNLHYMLPHLRRAILE